MLEHLHPGLVLIAGGALSTALPTRLRAALGPALPLLALALCWNAAPGWAPSWLGEALSPLAPDALSRLFATAFCLVAFLGALFGAFQTGAREMALCLVHAGSGLVIVFAGDWLSLFVGWELLALSSTLIVWLGGTKRAGPAGLRYLAIHALGGVLMLAGIAALFVETGSLTVAALTTTSAAGKLLLAGLLINLGAPPFSCLIADAYPESSATGMVFLSAFTTKSAVYLLLRCFAGHDLLVPLGLWMILYGIVYALLENDMRRILAYSVVNQVGFMVVGAGIGTELGVAGAAAHAFAHLIYKALLIMAAGSVLVVTGRRLCTELGGLARSLPFTTACALVGALSISAFPLTSGFVTKSLVTTAAAREGLALTFFVLMAASAGVFLHAGIKFPWFVFFHRDRGLRPSEPGWTLRAAMLLGALGCLLPGLWPRPLHDLLPHAVSEEVYTAAHVVFQLQLLLFGGLAFFALLPLLERSRTITLDWDWWWRVPGPALARWMARAAERTGQRAGAWATRGRGLLPASTGGFTTWPLGLSLFVLAFLLGAVLTWNTLS